MDNQLIFDLKDTGYPWQYPARGLLSPHRWGL